MSDCPIANLEQATAIRGSDLLAAVETLIAREATCIHQGQDAFVSAALRAEPCPQRMATSLALTGAADFIRGIRLRGTAAQAAGKPVPSQVAEAVNVLRSAFIFAYSKGVKDEAE